MKKRFAPVCPIQILEKMGYFYAGDYHLPLAHDVMKPENKERYRDWFGKLADDDKFNQRVVIMDNSVIELGDSVDITWLLEACDVARATHIVLPDSLCNAEETVRLSINAYQTLKPMGKFPAITVVPQGKTVAEWLWCAEELLRNIPVAMWGIPRNYERRLGSRYVAAKLLGIIAPIIPIHMLGFSEDLCMDMMNCHHPNVLGIDSAVPIRMGQAGTELSLTCEVPPRGDWWETVNDKTVIEDKTLLNLEKVRNWINSVE